MREGRFSQQSGMGTAAGENDVGQALPRGFPVGAVTPTLDLLRRQAEQAMEAFLPLWES